MNRVDPMRTFGARLALARERLHEAHRQRRQKRAEVDAMLAAADRAKDAEEAFLRRARETRDFDIADLLAREQETVTVEQPVIRYLPTTDPLPLVWLRTRFDLGFVTAADLDSTLPNTVGGVA